MQARLRALLEDNPQKAIKYFENELTEDISDARKNGLLYGLAIARQKNADYDQAEKLLSDLLENEPYQLAYQLQMASLNV